MKISSIVTTAIVGALLGFAPVAPLSAQAEGKMPFAQESNAATDVSARHRGQRYRVRTSHYRHGHRHYRVTRYYAERPFKYYYGPGYRLYWGHPHQYGPSTLMWPYDTAPYPHTTFGFGSW